MLEIKLGLAGGSGLCEFVELLLVSLLDVGRSSVRVLGISCVTNLIGWSCSFLHARDKKYPRLMLD